MARDLVLAVALDPDDGAARRQGPVRPGPGTGRADAVLTPSPVDRGGARRRTTGRLTAYTCRDAAAGRGTPVTTPARLRPSEVLAAQIAALRAISTGTSSEFLRGALDALHWLIGGGPGPLTADAAHTPVTVRAVVHQLAAARPSSTGAGATGASTPRASNMP